MSTVPLTLVTRSPTLGSRFSTADGGACSSFAKSAGTWAWDNKGEIALTAATLAVSLVFPPAGLAGLAVESVGVGLAVRGGVALAERAAVSAATRIGASGGIRAVGIRTVALLRGSKLGRMLVRNRTALGSFGKEAVTTGIETILNTVSTGAKAAAGVLAGAGQALDAVASSLGSSATGSAAKIMNGQDEETPQTKHPSASAPAAAAEDPSLPGNAARALLQRRSAAAPRAGSPVHPARPSVGPEIS
jgi:hypothetical protein